MLFIVDMEKFQSNYDISLQNINTRYKHDLHMPNTNLTSYQKAVHYREIKLFIAIPSNIKSFFMIQRY
jgi:hypothetical protein